MQGELGKVCRNSSLLYPNSYLFMERGWPLANIYFECWSYLELGSGEKIDRFLFITPTPFFYGAITGIFSAHFLRTSLYFVHMLTLLIYEDT